MTPPRRLKHLPVEEWPAEDRALFDAAFADGGIFDDDRGPGADFSAGSRHTIIFGWRRWLGFLAEHHPGDHRLPAADRVTMERIRDYIDNLGATMTDASVAATVAQLYNDVCLVARDRDWSWLKALKTRLQARAVPKDRFERLVPPHETLDLGIALMDAAAAPSTNGRKEAEIQFRDGLIVALLSLWPIRRRSLAALTLAHMEIGNGRTDILLKPEDTKAGRAESWPVADPLLPYLSRYLAEIRPLLAGRRNHDALWVGQRGNALGAGAIYEAVGRRTEIAFGKSMAPHDFRRSAATFLATDSPEKVGLIPGILQHATPETGDRYYNLARTAAASRRHSATIVELRERHRPKR